MLLLYSLHHSDLKLRMYLGRGGPQQQPTVGGVESGFNRARFGLKFAPFIFITINELNINLGAQENGVLTNGQANQPPLSPSIRPPGRGGHSSVTGLSQFYTGEGAWGYPLPCEKIKK
jgi:hypothetical protein